MFLALVPLALVAAVAAAVLVPESRDPSVPPLDLRGPGAVGRACSARWSSTIIEAPAPRLDLAVTLGRVRAAAPSSGVAFVLVERRAAHPMLDVALFRDRRFSAASGAVTVTFFALFGFIFLVTQYFQFVRGYGTLSTGAAHPAGRV